MLALAKALDLFESRGISQVLNQQIKVYPFINYILVTDIDSSVFAVSTRDAKGNKLPGEQLLMKSVGENPMYASAPNQNGENGIVGIDPYLSVLGLEKKYSQWFSSPVKKRGNTIGQVIVSIDWSSVNAQLLESIYSELLNTDNPIDSILITSKHGQIMSQSTNGGYKNLFGDSESGSFEVKPSQVIAKQSLSFGSDHHYDVIVAYDRARALEPISQASRIIIVATIFGNLFLGVILFVLLRRVIIGRIHTLHQATHKIAQGDLDYRLDDLDSDELGDLGSEINKMVTSLSENLTSIEYLNNEASLRKQALSELKDQKFALDQHAIVAVTDIHGNITYANDLFCEISEYSREELLGKNHRILNSGYHSKDFFRQMYMTISQGKVWHGEICNHSKSDREYWVDSTIVPFMGKNNKPTSYIAIRTDISQRKMIEEALQHAKHAAEDSARTKSEFLASMSHEIRTPMNGVLGMLGLLDKTELSESQHRQLTLAKTSAQSLLSIINDILDFSKIEAGKLELEEMDFNLCQMLGDFSEAQALRANEKGLELIIDTCKVDHTMVKGDPGRVRQILSNLVGNALKFTDNGEIVIRASLHDAGENGLIFICSISDTGIGIAKDKQTTLFDSFTQADASTTRKYGGTGLGLSICKQLCKLMNGSISVSSEMAHGTCFEFSVSFKPSKQSRPILPVADISKLNILVVDDNATNREVLKSQLSLWDAKVALASNAFCALELLNQSVAVSPFDMAILDYQMPAMDGAELGKRIRSDRRFDSLKLVMMTSISHPGDAKYFANLGFQAYFPKPVTLDDLFNMLAVVGEDGTALGEASPLVTSHYLHELSSPALPDEQLEREIAEFNHEVRILLVEDNPINQEVAVGILEGMGFEIDVVANGLEALQALKQMEFEAPYDLVLMDCQMPEMDGYEATKAIRSQQAGARNQAIHIIAMTANVMKGDREKCLAAGMNDYVGKPIDPAELDAKIGNYLREIKSEVPKDDSTSNLLQLDSSLPVWNRQKLLDTLRGNTQRLDKLVKMFVDSIPEKVCNLNEAITSEDFDKASEISHAIKGSAANLRAEQFAAHISDLELHAKKKDKATLQKLKTQTEALLEILLEEFE